MTMRGAAGVAVAGTMSGRTVASGDGAAAVATDREPAPDSATPLQWGGVVLFAGWLIYDAQLAGKRPGILLCHEGLGLGEHAQERACMLAELGYVVLAPDLFGEAFRHREHGITVITELVRIAPALRN